VTVRTPGRPASQLSTTKKKLEARARKQATFVAQLQQENAQMRRAQAEQHQLAAALQEARCERAQLELLERRCEQSRELCERQRDQLQEVSVRVPPNAPSCVEASARRRVDELIPLGNNSKGRGRGVHAP
jgi:hypothetical protein